MNAILLTDWNKYKFRIRK